MGLTTNVIRHATSRRIQEYYATWTGDNSIVFEPDFSFKFINATVHFDASVSNNCSLSKIAVGDAGENYDTVIATADNTGGQTDNLFVGDDSTIFIEGTALKLACNVSSNNAYGMILVEEYNIIGSEE